MMAQSKTNYFKIIITIMLFFSSAIVFEFLKISFFLYLQCLFCLVCLLKYKRIYISKSVLSLILVSVVISGILPLVGKIPMSWKLCTRNYMIMWIPLYFTATYLRRWINGDGEKSLFIVKTLKKVFLIQLIWFPIQFIMYNLLGIDINDLLFNQIFGLRQNVSFIREGVYYPSGLTWHSAVVAPLFVLSLALFNKGWIKCLVLFDAAICGNATAVIGVLVYYVVFIGKSIFNNRIKKKTTYRVLLIGLVGLVAGYFLGIYDKVFTLIQNIVYRIVVMEDASSQAHLRYLTSIPLVFRNSNMLEILFGYGNACSGYPHTVLFHQYIKLKSWVTECDISNILLSRGIFGFVFYYYFLMRIIAIGKNINIKYLAVMVAIIIEGVTYNVQFDYVFLIECILLFSAQWKIDLFSIDSKSRL